MKAHFIKLKAIRISKQGMRVFLNYVMVWLS